VQKGAKPMRTKKSAFGIAAGVIACAVVVWYSGVIEGYERTYEIRPEIRLPENRTDAARAIDAYERLMERYMSVTERNFGGVNVDLKGIGKRLDSIDGKLAGLSERVGRIEKALGIEPPKKAVVEQLRSKTGEQAGGAPRIRALESSGGDEAPLKEAEEKPDDAGKAGGG
jgi:hypothetical protein